MQTRLNPRVLVVGEHSMQVDIQSIRSQSPGLDPPHSPAEGLLRLILILMDLISTMPFKSSYLLHPNLAVDVLALSVETRSLAHSVSDRF